MLVDPSRRRWGAPAGLGADARHPVLAGLEDAHRWWEAVLVAVLEEEMGDRLGPVAGPYAESTEAGFVLHQLDEMIHQGAEIGLLRDLYAAGRSLPATDSPDPLIRLSGEEVAARHHAAAADRADLVRLLPSAGADPDRRDDHWQATPLGWAECFGAAGAADALSSWPGRPGPGR